MSYESGRDSRERCTNGVSPPGARPRRADLLHRRGQRGRPSYVDGRHKRAPCPTQTCFEYGVGERAGSGADTARWGCAPFPFTACSPCPRGRRRVRRSMARSPPLRHSSPDRLGAHGSSYDPRRPNRWVCGRPSGVASCGGVTREPMSYSDQQRAVVEALGLSPDDLRGLAGALESEERIVSVREVAQAHLATLPHHHRYAKSLNRVMLWGGDDNAAAVRPADVSAWALRGSRRGPCRPEGPPRRRRSRGFDLGHPGRLRGCDRVRLGPSQPGGSGWAP